MPTLINPATQQENQQVSKYFPNASGRPVGSKNRLPSVQIRHELERVYERMGGFDGLFRFANSEEGRGKFYEWFVKIFAAYELKEPGGKDPIRVIVYGKEGHAVEILGPSPISTALADPPVIDETS